MSNLTLVSTREAASILHVGTRQIARYVKTGKLEPAAKLPGVRGAFLFRRNDVEHMAAERAA